MTATPSAPPPPGAPPDVRAVGPRPLPLVGGVIGALGGLISLASLFPDYEDGRFPLSERPSERWFMVLFFAGVVAAVAMLVAQRATQPTGAAMLGALALTFLGSNVLRFEMVRNELFPARRGPGFVLDMGGFALVVVGAVIALAGVLIEPAPATAAASTATRAAAAVAGGFAGFVAAVGFGLNSFRFEFDPRAVQGGGSPLMPQLPRALWAQLLVVVAITTVPVLIAYTRRPVAAGLAAGVGLFVLAEVVRRILEVHSKERGMDPPLESIEGTWVLLVGLVLLGLAFLVRFLVVADGPSRETPATTGHAGP